MMSSKFRCVCAITLSIDSGRYSGSLDNALNTGNTTVTKSSVSACKVSDIARAKTDHGENLGFIRHAAEAPFRVQPGGYDVGRWCWRIRGCRIDPRGDQPARGKQRRRRVLHWQPCDVHETGGLQCRLQGVRREHDEMARWLQQTRVGAEPRVRGTIQVRYLHPDTP